jgi:branched-chain amino acid transport system permease protein
MIATLLAVDSSAGQIFVQHCLTGLSNGMLIALIALGYTMVYGIVELVNFAHGDLVMLGSFFALYAVTSAGFAALGGSTLGIVLMVVLLIVATGLLSAAINWANDWVVYRPLRKAPRLAPLVSAIGLSFIFMNIGMVWSSARPASFPDLLSEQNLLGDSGVKFTIKDLIVIGVTVPIMIALTLFVKYTKLGKAMRATAQDPIASQLMGIPSNRVIGVTFAIGGALAGAASVIYCLYINQIVFNMGYTVGLYAFTAAVLGGIGKLPGAVLGGILIGLIRSMGSGYFDERWTSALIFVILIAILVFRPAGLLGDRRREKV